MHIVCVRSLMVAWLVVCIMCVCSGAILEGNCFPFRFSEGGYFFFFSFSKTFSLLLSENHYMYHGKQEKQDRTQNRACCHPFMFNKDKFSNVLLPFPHPFSFTTITCGCGLPNRNYKKKVSVSYIINSPVS